MFEVSEGAMFSIREVAQMLGVSYGTIDKAARAKEIGHYRIGGKRLVASDDLRKFVNKRRVSSVNEENSVTTP